MTITKSLIGKEDLKLYDGVSTTFSRPTSTGGTSTYSKIDWFGVDVLYTYGRGTAKTGGSITAAITAIGTRKASIWLQPGEWTVSNDFTIPKNIKLVMHYGAVLTGSSTVTIIGELEVYPECFSEGLVVKGLNLSMPEYWLMNTSPGTTDMGAAIQSAALSLVDGGVCAFKGEIYSVSTGVSIAWADMNAIKFKGQGDRATIIQATTAITMFDVSGKDASNLQSGVNFEDLQIDGGDIATVGISFVHMHFFEWSNVTIVNVNGYALYAEDIEDGNFSACDFRKSGDFANSKEAVLLYFAGGGQINSVTFTNNCIFERNYYTALRLHRTENVGILGCKFHGRNANDDPGGPDPNDLIQIDGCSRTRIVANGFEAVRKYAIKVLNNVNELGATISDNDFRNSGLTGSTTLAYVYIDAGFHNINGNKFLPPTDADELASYTTDHYDIRLTSDSLGAQGSNLHMGAPLYKVFDQSTSGVHPDYYDGNNSGYLSFNASTSEIYSARVRDDAYPRVMVRLNQIELGDGTTDGDVILKRAAADVFALGDGDGLGIGNALSNTNTPSGGTSKAMPIYNHNGALIGYIPIYAAQW